MEQFGGIETLGGEVVRKEVKGDAAAHLYHQEHPHSYHHAYTRWADIGDGVAEDGDVCEFDER
jgi:hypothetical protein